MEDEQFFGVNEIDPIEYRRVLTPPESPRKWLLTSRPPEAYGASERERRVEVAGREPINANRCLFCAGRAAGPARDVLASSPYVVVEEDDGEFVYDGTVAADEIYRSRMYESGQTLTAYYFLPTNLSEEQYEFHLFALVNTGEEIEEYRFSGYGDADPIERVTPARLVTDLGSESRHYDGILDEIDRYFSD